MKTLSNIEIAKLLFWIENNGKGNWGAWSNYPLSGCTYSSIEDCQIFIKFDSVVTYQGEKISHVVSSRAYVKNNRITVSSLKSLYLESKDQYYFDLISENEKNVREEKEKKDLEKKIYSDLVKSGSLDIEFRNQVEFDLNYLVDFYLKNKTFFKDVKVGETVVSSVRFGLGSQASGLYDEETRSYLSGLEKLIESNEYEYFVDSKSNKGNTKYGVITAESFAKFESIFPREEYISRMIEVKRKKATIN